MHARHLQTPWVQSTYEILLERKEFSHQLDAMGQCVATQLLRSQLRRTDLELAAVTPHARPYESCYLERCPLYPAYKTHIPGNSPPRGNLASV